MSGVTWGKPAWRHGDGWAVSGVAPYPLPSCVYDSSLYRLPHCVKMYSKHNKMSPEKGILQAVKTISGRSKIVCRELGLKNEYLALYQPNNVTPLQCRQVCSEGLSLELLSSETGGARVLEGRVRLPWRSDTGFYLLSPLGLLCGGQRHVPVSHGRQCTWLSSF